MTVDCGLTHSHGSWPSSPPPFIFLSCARVHREEERAFARKIISHHHRHDRLGLHHESSFIPSLARIARCSLLDGHC
jgi:hypothetical protein